MKMMRHDHVSMNECVWKEREFPKLLPNRLHIHHYDEDDGN